MKNKSSNYSISVGGHDVNITPKCSEVHPEYCISLEQFRDWFTIISELSTKTMMSEGSITLLDVRFHEHSRNEILSDDVYIFNAISIRDMDVLNRASFIKNKEIYINMRQNSELYLCMPRYVSSDDPVLSSLGNSNPQPVEKLEEGERYDIKVGYSRLADTTYGNVSEKTVVDSIEI